MVNNRSKVFNYTSLLAFLFLFTLGCHYGDDPLSDDSSLSSLTVSEGGLSPTFSSVTTAYDVAVSNEATTIQVTARLSDPTASMTIDGISTSSGTVSAQIDLLVGDNNIRIVSTAENGSSTTTTITVNRAERPSDDSSLLDLTVSVGSLNPTFSSDTLSYNVQLEGGVEAISITATSNDDGATININNADVDSGSVSDPIILIAGSNNILVQVISEDGSNVSDYNLRVIVGDRLTIAEIGSIASARFSNTGWNLDGSVMTNTLAKMNNTDLFGPEGIVKTTLNVTNTALNLGDVNAALLANFDVFFIGYLSDGDENAFLEDELLAFSEWVNQGGIMVVTCDDAEYDAVCEYFGHPSTTSSIPPTVPTAAGVVHPLFGNSFGVVTSLQMNGTFGRFEITDGATVLGIESEDTGYATILEKEIGLGRVIFLSDIDMISNDTVSDEQTMVNDNDIFLGNLFEYVTGIFAQ